MDKTDKQKRKGMEGGEKIDSVRPVLVVAAVFAVLLLPLSMGKAVNPTKGENHCFTCHTSARTLVEITREIAKSNKSISGSSPENKGEG
jgi:hypothetical protein